MQTGPGASLHQHARVAEGGPTGTGGGVGIREIGAEVYGIWGGGEHVMGDTFFMTLCSAVRLQPIHIDAYYDVEQWPVIILKVLSQSFLALGNIQYCVYTCHL